MGTIYRFTNLINERIYVGQTTQILGDRIAQHKYAATKGQKNVYFLNALRKYGIQSFSINIIDTANDIDILNEKEIYWMKKLNSLYPNGYNMLMGGNNSRRSPESIRKMVESRKRSGWKPTIEHRKAISEKLTGRKYPEWGHKISLRQTGIKFSEERKRKIGEANKGKVRTEEVKKRMSEIVRNRPRLKTDFFKGQVAWNKGKPMSEESKKKLSESQKRRFCSMAIQPTIN